MLFKMGETRACCPAQGALVNVMRWPGWEGSLGRMDTCIRMAESLRCSPETTTTLLIGYISIQNERFKVFKKRGGVSLSLPDSDLLETRY